MIPDQFAYVAPATLPEARRQRIGFDLDAPPPPRAEAIDPICGMTVDIATARYSSERDGLMHYFCCAGCKASFEAAG